MSKMKKRHVLLGLWLLFLFCFLSFSEELPIPNYNNVVIISIEHPVTDTFEVQYIKDRFNFGLYAWLSFSRTFISPILDWHTAWNEADLGIQAFKDNIDYHIYEAIANGVKLHIVMCSGLARGIYIYREAKEEDIRNCQWYNDNKLASDSQIVDPGLMDNYVFGTLSRYARKMRSNLEAKARASLAFLKQRMDEEPDILVALSGWGEAELNSHRIIQGQSLQDYFCDYSPFAVLEFADWIRHTGMYNDVDGAYAGEGYSGGGTLYQGPTGLVQFNQDFGTNFTTWDLKYYNWSLADDYDQNPVDFVNTDPNHIPFSSYSHGNMMPTSGGNYIQGGFDPPRVMQPGYNFWDLWQLFRETMVHNFVKDMAMWASEAGIHPDRWYSHQIPGDYLFGKNPDSVSPNPRYYSGASPLWTADIQPFGSMGATMYDIKFPGWFARTTEYGVPAISAMSPNWGILEYDAETYPTGQNVEQSSPDFIYQQYMNVYNHNAHLINFWRWLDDSGEHRIKGMNKATALKRFLDAIRDKGRRTNLAFVFDPPRISEATGYYAASVGLVIVIDEHIWDGYPWKWRDWGDFDSFEIHRGTTPGFTPDGSTLIATTPNYVYNDASYTQGSGFYYKVRAVNSEGVGGPYSDEIAVVPAEFPVPRLSVSQNNLYFGAERGQTTTSPEEVIVMNLGTSGTTLDWTATPDASWLQVTPSNGVGNGLLSISVNISGLAEGTYLGNVTVEDPYALDSPQAIQVQLRVYGLGWDSEPFGVFDTPIHGTTVSANVPVTGWALDDIEVTRVQIKRSSHSNDNPAAIGPDGLVFVGDAYFVKGARPDVEAVYPDYPKSNRAGWGLMVLTNMFPNQGNGLFTLHAFAYDGSGHKVKLGQKDIYCDNANRTRPFGTLDTPRLGGVISGDNYVNFGWALTAQPKYIPLDGSTILVWVDGVPLGHPNYGNYREDIATKFPGYANSDSAVGHFRIDTTQYANGVHRISWNVRDSAGEAAGIGARRFEIQNVGGAVAALDSMPATQDFSELLAIDVKGYELGMKSWLLRDGTEFRLKMPQRRKRNRQDNEVWIEMEEVGRLELHLEGRGGNHFIGWGRTNVEGLPEGSTLDKGNGVFYWMPSPGFLGKHVLHFAVSDGIHRNKPMKVVVSIVPRGSERNNKVQPIK
jgi:hypothetical protein